jgi:chorismate mutase/prephenate dehydratase
MSQELPNSLLALRETIDSLDIQLLETLSKRLTASRDVMEIKDAQNMAQRDLAREQSLIRTLIGEGRKLGLDAHFITKIFHEILAEGNRVQQDYLQSKLNSRPQRSCVRIAFQGIDGSYSHLAGRNFFSSSHPEANRQESEFVGFGSYLEAVKAVENGECDYGILPIENTTSGAINDVYDLLLHSRVSIVGGVTSS